MKSGWLIRDDTDVVTEFEEKPRYISSPILRCLGGAVSCISLKQL